MAFVHATCCETQAPISINVQNIVVVYPEVGRTTIRTNDQIGQYSVSERYEDLMSQIAAAEGFVPK